MTPVKKKAVKAKKLSKTSKSLLDAFDAAAKSWGWQADQGYGAEVGQSQAAYQEARAKLEARLLKLEGA